MRKKLAIFFAAVFVSIFGAVACGGEEKEKQPAQEEPKEETTVQEGPPSLEQLPEEVKEKLPDEIKEKLKEQEQP